ncbi:hypothetical protein B0T09DRAFT_348141 [Sordaria sp. MPI-SDFR-AT-0083]|nr:hypothetical protein B0T09DRAFT_348141 [Sordaria sp. MPI-SDFR-AT-0083]
MFRFCQRRVFTVPPFSFCRPQQQNSTKKPIGSDDLCRAPHHRRGRWIGHGAMLCSRTRGKG